MRWRSADRTRCRRSPRRRSLRPELALCPLPPRFRSLAAGVPVPVLCPGSCRAPDPDPDPDPDPALCSRAVTLKSKSREKHIRAFFGERKFTTEY